MSLSLNALSSEFKQILVKIEENEGVLDESLDFLLAQNLQDTTKKVSDYCFTFDRLENEIEFTKLQIKNANEYIKKLQAVIDRMQAVALKVMHDTERKKLEGENGRYITTRKSQSCEIIDEALISEFYKKIEIKIDKAAIKDALKKGEIVEGVELKENININWK